jgi:hypothetical protein
MIVTFDPNAAKTSANSQPTAPAPTIAIDFGAFSRISASSLEMIVVLFSSSPACGSPFTREPVQITTAFVAVCVSAFPSAPTTFTDLPPASAPVPLIHVILFFLKRNSTPFEFLVLTSRERFIATWKSSFTSPTVTPNSAACVTFVARLAASRSALAGMHPQSTQVPPSPSFSTTATVRPSWALRIAPT